MMRGTDNRLLTRRILFLIYPLGIALSQRSADHQLNLMENH